MGAQQFCFAQRVQKRLRLPPEAVILPSAHVIRSFHEAADRRILPQLDTRWPAVALQP